MQCRFGSVGAGRERQVGAQRCAPSVKSIQAHRLGEPGHFPAPKLTDVYQKTSLSTPVRCWIKRQHLGGCQIGEPKSTGTEVGAVPRW